MVLFTSIFLNKIVILLIGDGNENSGWTTFKDCIKAALNGGWRVELWSWRTCLSKSLLTLSYENSDRMTVEYLDDKDIDLEYRKSSLADGNIKLLLFYF